MAQGVLERPETDLLLALHTTEAPSHVEWDDWCELTRRYAEAVQWDLSRVSCLVITDGGAPTREQRTQAARVVAQGRSLPRIVMITDSTAVRMLTLAFAILTPSFKVFSPKDLSTALSILGVPRPLRRTLFAALDRMEEEQLGRGAVKTLNVLRQAVR